MSTRRNLDIKRQVETSSEDFNVTVERGGKEGISSLGGLIQLNGNGDACRGTAILHARAWPRECTRSLIITVNGQGFDDCARLMASGRFLCGVRLVARTSLSARIKPACDNLEKLDFLVYCTIVIYSVLILAKFYIFFLQLLLQQLHTIHAVDILILFIY